MADTARPPLGSYRRIVVKLGSALLIEAGRNAVRMGWLRALARDIVELRTAGVEVAIVSSGAIAVGREKLGLGTRSLRLQEKQAAAAVGQIGIIGAFETVLAEQALVAAQLLLTIEDTEARRRHLNARATVEALFEIGAVPVFNENDTLATEEIRFGDNDRLAARIAQMIGADLLILLSDVDGLYTGDPRHDPEARRLARVERITPEILAMAGKPPPGYSSGGMITKLEAARIATAAGCAMIIARGTADHALASLSDPDSPATWFAPTTEPLSARKAWIAAHVSAAGTLHVDAGCAAALARGKSLLPAGVTQVEGSFARGDLLIVKAPDGTELGRGLSAWDSEDARQIIGKRSSEIEGIVGWRGRDWLIHRDDFVATLPPVDAAAPSPIGA